MVRREPYAKLVTTTTTQERHVRCIGSELSCSMCLGVSWCSIVDCFSGGVPTMVELVVFRVIATYKKYCTVEFIIE